MIGYKKILSSKKVAKRKKTNTEPRETQNDEKNSKTGRRELSFSESSERSKRRKTEELRAKVSTEALLYSATSKLRSEGNIDFAKVVRDISEGSPTKAARYRKSLESTNNNVPFTENEALSLYVELGLSQSKYQLLRNAHMEKNHGCFQHIKRSKKQSYSVILQQVCHSLKMKQQLHCSLYLIIQVVALSYFTWKL